MENVFFIFSFTNESEYRKKERSLRKYNMLAYKKLIFDYYPKLRDGNFIGMMINKNEETNTTYYELELPSDILFSRVHGVIKLHYSVNLDNNLITFDTITPEEILTEGHRTELSTYKGVMISNEHKEKDRFKIELMNMLDK
jgi:hypothetical protein